MLLDVRPFGDQEKRCGSSVSRQSTPSFTCAFDLCMGLTFRIVELFEQSDELVLVALLDAEVVDVKVIALRCQRLL